MEISITKRKLHNKEIEALIEEIKKFPNPLTGNKSRWRNFKQVYIATTNNDLIGICAVIELKDWFKLGPFVVFEKYQKQGYGKKIFETIVQDYSNNNLFVGSRSPAVAKIATWLGFKEIPSIWILPNTIKLYLIKHILQSLSIDSMKEFIKKKPTQEGPYRLFLKKNIPNLRKIKGKINIVINPS